MLVSYRCLVCSKYCHNVKLNQVCRMKKIEANKNWAVCKTRFNIHFFSDTIAIHMTEKKNRLKQRRSSLHTKIKFEYQNLLHKNQTNKKKVTKSKQNKKLTAKFNVDFYFQRMCRISARFFLFVCYFLFW